MTPEALEKGFEVQERIEHIKAQIASWTAMARTNRDPVFGNDDLRMILPYSEHLSNDAFAEIKRSALCCLKLRLAEAEQEFADL